MGGSCKKHFVYLTTTNKLKMIRNRHIAILVLIIGCILTSPVPEENLQKKLISDEGGDYENVEVLLTAQGVSYPLPDGRKPRALVKPQAPVADGQVVAENKARALVDHIEYDYDPRGSRVPAVYGYGY